MAPKKQKKKVALAYSGGLDTSVIVKWLQENLNADVVAVCVNVGQSEDLRAHAVRAREMGAEVFMVDAVHEFATEYIMPALRANLLYGGSYPAGTALARHLICEKVVQVAKKTGASALAHGCTAKGNDQVRFEASFAVLAPELEVIAPIRIWAPSREAEMEYAAAHGIRIPFALSDPPYSIDENLWGRSIEGGNLEDPMFEPPEEAFLWTSGPDEMPNEPSIVTVDFEHGTPVSVDGREMRPVELVYYLNTLAGRHGIGRIDHIEDRVIGIKAREVYEYPAAMALLTAHKALEKLTLSKDVLDFKLHAEQTYAQLVYGGKWFSTLRKSLQTFIDELQQSVTGEVKMKLYKGTCTVIGLSSPNSLYDSGLATFGTDDAFDHAAADGFLKLYTLPLRASAKAGAIKADEFTHARPHAKAKSAGD